MDDSRFDDIIKNQVDEFDQVEFDPSALAGLHYKMDSSIRPSFYNRYRNEILVAAATTVIAVLILFGINHSGNNVALLQQQIADLKNQNEKFGELGNLLQESKNQQIVPADTIRIIEYRNSNDLYYNRLVSEIDQLRRQLNEGQNQSRLMSDTFRRDLVYLGREDQVSDDILRELENGQIVQNGDYLFLVVDDLVVAEQNPYLVKRKGLTHEYRLPEYFFIWDSTATDDQLANVEPVPVQISIKKLKELERHYKKGLGIDIGPSVSLQKGLYSSNASFNVFGGGIVADFIMSPTLSIESGLTFNTTHYDVEMEDLQSLSLPTSDPIYGAVENAEITAWFMEILSSLKYRQRISQKNHLVYGAGASAFWYTKQAIEFGHLFETNTITVPVESSYRIRKPELYFGTFNLSLGLSAALKNGKRLETSLVHKTNLGKLGSEQVASNFIGVKASYLFKAR
ncbi:hypothetical protein [Fulvivirga sp.]|uniref:hypothetical protein n=1 Tax=Fulvivirga sp. TaxID=1931237 RepID=UPI0032EAC0ED